ncbi:MAG TPA: hypothetical protein VEN81_07080 [Planctomycetota bacterium]|nr:hypothetical protein [Planctomycetota bacterium]
MRHTLWMLPFLAAPAWGQAEDVYKSLALGDRVQITFRSGGTITGNLDVNPIGQKAKPRADGQPEEALDYTKETSLTINLSWEYPGLTGTMTILKTEIKDLKKLQILDRETLDRLRKQKALIQKDLARQNDQLRKDSIKRDKDAQAEVAKMEAKSKSENDALAQAAEDAKKAKLAEEGQKLLKKFPPDGGWGPQKLEDIQRRSSQKLSVITPDEMEFVQSYQLWVRARDAVATPAPAPAPTPAPGNQ